jgi:hypothetical protein
VEAHALCTSLILRFFSRFTSSAVSRLARVARSFLDSRCRLRLLSCLRTRPSIERGYVAIAPPPGSSDLRPAHR